MSKFNNSNIKSDYRDSTAYSIMSMTMTSSDSVIDTAIHTEKAALLKKAQAMIELEQMLTATVEKVEPWLPNANAASNANSRPRVRPLPTSMEQVEVILAVSRNWAARTSAPAGWNPAAPVMGFTTPNPMPHQLRGGALAGMQLERARQVISLLTRPQTKLKLWSLLAQDLKHGIE
jgi:hypothetical protein